MIMNRFRTLANGDLGRRAGRVVLRLRLRLSHVQAKAWAKPIRNHQSIAAGFYYSILFMMSMPYIILGSFGSLAYPLDPPREGADNRRSRTTTSNCPASFPASAGFLSTLGSGATLRTAVLCIVGGKDGCRQSLSWPIKPSLLPSAPVYANALLPSALGHTV